MNKKSLFALFAISLFVLAFLISVVSAQATSQPVAAIFDPVKEMFTSWQDGNLSVNIAKYVFLILLTLVIYSVVTFIPFLNSLHIYTRFVVALLVSFLATAYLTPSDLYTTLASYGALGIVMGAALPFIILLFFTIQLNRDAGVSGKLFSKFMWVAFVLFLVWKLIDGIFGITTGGTKLVESWEGWTYVGFIVACLLWIWFGERQFVKILFKEEFHAQEAENLVDVIRSLDDEINRRDKNTSLSGAASATWNRKTDDLRKQRDELKKRIAKP